MDLKGKPPSSRKFSFLEPGCTFRMVFRKPASTTPSTVGWSWGMCFRFFLLCSPRWARPEESRRRFPALASESLLPGRLPRGHPGQGSPGSQHNSWNSRFSGHLHGLESPQSGSLETWAATHVWPWCGVEGSLQLWLHYLTAAFSCVQLDSSFCSALKSHGGNLWNPSLFVVRWVTC